MFAYTDPVLYTVFHGSGDCDFRAILSQYSSDVMMKWDSADMLSVPKSSIPHL